MTTSQIDTSNNRSPSPMKSAKIVSDGQDSTNGSDPLLRNNIAPIPTNDQLQEG